MSKPAKWVIGILVGGLVAILAVSAFFMVRGKIYSGKVVTTVAPSIAVVMVGENEFKATGEYEIQPGEYTVTVSAPGFESKSGRLKVSDGASVNVNLYLLPLAENALWYDEHPEDALIMGEIKNAERMAEVEKLLNETPILKELPRTVEYFTDGMREYVKYVISYEFDDSEYGYHLIVKDYTGGNLEAAVEWASNYNVGVEVLYEDLTNDRL